MKLKKCLLSIIVVGCIHSSQACTDAKRDASGVIITKSTCIIFITHGQYKGNFGGYNGANTICNNEAREIHSDLTNQGISFKALLAWNHATTIGKEYFQEDGVTLIATASSSTLARSLQNPITPWTSYDDRVEFWLGAHEGLSSDGSDYCDTWTKTVYKGSGAFPRSHDNHADTAYGVEKGIMWNPKSTNARCGVPHHLACVAQ